MSDHLPLLAMLKQTKLLNKEPLTFTSRCLNDEKLKKANHEFMRKDWLGLLTGMMSNTKFNQFSDTVNQVLDKVAPVKTVCIAPKRRYVEPWMMKGLERHLRSNLIYTKRAFKKNSTDEDHQRYKQHRNMYNDLKRKLKWEYYQSKCQVYKNNSKKLWALINNTIKKVRHKGSIIPFITVDSLKQNRPKAIANNFGEFYSTLGSSLAEKIDPGTTSIEEYLDSIPIQRDSIVIKQTTPLEIDTIIRNLPNKTSHGHDEISNMMLKAL